MKRPPNNEAWRRGMRVFVSILILLSVAAVSTWPAMAQDPAAENFAAGELLVEFRPGTSSTARADRMARYGAEFSRSLYQSDTQLWRVPVGDELAIAKQLSLDPSVAYAEPNYIYRAFNAPTDSDLAKQWAHSLMQSTAAWDITTGSSSVTIAIIDTGIDEGHPDLTGKIVAGHDFVDGDTNPHDLNGHGTHCAGIAAAVSNNNLGIAGMDWQARIMPVRVLAADGIGYNSDIIDGITWAYTQGADVLSLSLGGNSDSTLMQNAINAAHAAGSLVVAAMGNENTNESFYPAASDNVLAVAATTRTDNKAIYSNYGNHCDVSAPGGETNYVNENGIYSTMPTYNVFLNTEYGIAKNYAFLQGTSQATPYVAGLAGLIWATQPGLTPDQVQVIIEATATDLGTAGWDQYFGHGRINALAALEAATVPPAPTLDAISNADGDGSYLVNWNDINTATGYTLQEDDNAGFGSPVTRYTGASSQYAISGQQAGSWYYRVRASNAYGSGNWSNVVSAGVVPPAPTLNAISNSGEQDAYLISWSAATSALGYTLEEANNASFSGAIVRYAGRDLQYQVTGQRNGNWYYRVKASNAVGDSGWSNSRSTTVSAAVLPPPTLDLINNSDGDNAYLVNWNDVLSATGYLLEESGDPYFASTTVVYSGTQSQYAVSDQAGGTWYYRVRALGATGDGPWSIPRSAAVQVNTFLPLTLKNQRTAPASFTISNGDFESGASVWTEYSIHEYPLILNGDFPGTVSPHSGSWAVWLGGDDYETAYVEQQITVPSGQPYLSYWRWIASEDYCDYDYGYVKLDNTIIESYTLCSDTSTGGWSQRVLDLSAFIGQSVTLKLEATTDISLNSNLFIDDVQLQASATTAQQPVMQVDRLAAGPR